MHKKPRINLSSIRLRLSVILVIGILLISIFFFSIIKVDNEQEQNLFSSRLKSKQTIFNLTVNNGSEQMKTFAVDYTYWDDMVSFVNGGGKNLDFAHENIDTGLSTYDTDAVWVYNSQYRLVYTVNNNDQDVGGLDTQSLHPLSANDMARIFKNNGVYDFYASTPKGIFELDAASIHPTNDPDRKTPAQGYFITGKLLDKSYFGHIGKAIEGNSYVLSDPAQFGNFHNGYDINAAVINFGKELTGYNGSKIGELVGSYTASDLKSALVRQDQINRFGLITFELLTLVLVVFLVRWVIMPMNKVQRALATGGIKHLGSLTARNDEFGSISRLVARSFEQQRLLTAQKEVVEKEVEARTKELQNEEATLKTLVDSMPVGVYMASAPDGKPVLMNEIGVQILGRNLMEDTNKDNLAEKYDNIKENGTPYPSSELPLNITLATRKRVLKDDIISLRPDGSRAYLRIVSAPIINSDGSMPYVVAIFEDITKERDMERSRDEFFSIASHELRTPLTAIRGNTSMIKQYYADSLKDPELKEMIDDIHESSIRLIDIVNDFLDTSRLEQRKVKFEAEELNLAEVAKNVIKEYSLTGLKQKVHLRIEEPKPDLPNVWADKDRTKQIIINLVGNALKFTLDGSITISFEKDGDFVKTYVKDTGAGMDEDAQAKLFRKFEQTNKKILTRDSVQGTGLGLYISKMIVEQMGGHIKLESSKLGQGTVFSFTLPITKPEVK